MQEFNCKTGSQYELNLFVRWRERLFYCRESTGVENTFKLFLVKKKGTKFRCSGQLLQQVLTEGNFNLHDKKFLLPPTSVILTNLKLHILNSALLITR